MVYLRVLTLYTNPLNARVQCLFAFLKKKERKKKKKIIHANFNAYNVYLKNMFIFVNSITWNAFRKIRATPQRRKYAKELVRSVHRRRKRTYRFCRKKRLFAYIPGSCSVSRFTRKKKTTKEKKKERDKLIYPLFNPNVEVNSSEGRRVSEITWGPRDRKTVGSVCRKTLRSFPLRPLGDFSRSYDNHVIARAINQLKTTKVTTPSEFRTRYHQPYSSLLQQTSSKIFLLRST